MASETLIRAAQVIAYQDGVGHVLLEPGALVVRGREVTWVGPPEAAPACAAEIDAAHMLVAPGFVNVHTHYTTPVTRAFREDYRNRLLYQSGLYEMLPVGFTLQADDAAVSTEASFIELLRGGSTTVVVMGTSIPERTVDIAARLGIRAYVTPGFRAGGWRVAPSGTHVLYDLDEAQGQQGLARNVAFVEEYDGAHDGLVHALLGPGQVDTCTPELLSATRRAADRLGVPVQIHASQSLQEFQEIGRRHGRTPLQHLHDTGLMGPDLSVAHTIFIAGHSWTAVPAEDDLQLLADSGTYVCHCPMVFARSAVTLESLPRYLRAGVRVAIGTDTIPQDILGEMRLAALLGKIAERDGGAAAAAEVYRAATLTGAALLDRPDLGRIAPGAQADLLFFDLDRVTMQSRRDPLRTLVYSAAPADIARVMVAGRTVVEHGRVLTADEPAVAAALADVTDRLWTRVPRVDWAGHGIDQLSLPSLPRWS
jgi:cytosine/adenosine deaminase-related metal-dependent hydrolase